MRDTKREQNKNIIKRFMVLFMTVILVTGLAACSGKSSGTSIKPGSSILPAPAKSITEAPTKNANEIDLTGVLTYVNTSELKMHFMDIDTGNEYEVSYTGGTDIQNKYKSIIAATNMKMGDIFNVTCNKSGKALKIYESSNAWEKTGVKDVSFDENSRKLSSGASSYSYDSHAVILSNSQQISIAEIVSEDEVTLRGVDDTVYSINVDKGHGYITFTGIDSFVGGYVTIGQKQLFHVSKGMLVTAPEGTYAVELQKDSLVGSKTVTVTRDQQVAVDYSECTTQAAKRGAVNFSITPVGAVLTIDGVETDYSQPVSLTYGTHKIVLSANHYDQYTETITVNSAYQTKVIDMSSSSSSTTSAAKGTTTTATTAASATTAANLTTGYSVSMTAPQGASLYVDSVYVGVIPCSFDKTQGNKTVTLTQNGYATVSYTISIANATGNLTYAFPDMVAKTSN
jgi:hypothetical protein